MTAAPHLTAAKVAERLGISVNALYLRRHRGCAPRAIKPGKNNAKLLFPLANVEAWEREHTA